MLTIRRPLGFGGTAQAAEFFGISKADVLAKAKSGEWPSYVISSRRVFDFDAVLDLLVGRDDASDDGGDSE